MQHLKVTQTHIGNKTKAISMILTKVITYTRTNPRPENQEMAFFYFLVQFARLELYKDSLSTLVVSGCSDFMI